ncbi:MULTISPECIES: GntR family transcriptional regulator [Streptomyces]|uniref:GntR family transcriptional regulator n=1 Tax=Streptomyces decoyicus TaxID=249567 RepID=A0ABZ1FS63_9ACTN|nr:MULTISPECIES: GntR family transcriptional regulator [Streptomyces]MCL7493569.1 GntR family transcriptional regulator [Streptomyces sp. MCA2]WSB72921.1 GntR family transcriptional regulator [Streptomyces decoyicus]BDH12018.1 GntR family transcriptional regulator [Streptomyces hygroscopicus]
MQSGREKAYAYLKESVLTDPEMQDRFLSEQEIADRIGVSRTPIREALLLLAAEDLVRLVPKRGAHIAPLSGREIRELMEMRGLIERFAAERTTDRGTAPVDEMAGILAHQDTLRGEDSTKEFIAADHRFHATLVAAVGNTLMSRQYDALRSRQIRAGVLALYRSGNRQDDVLAEHRRILDGLVAGDAKAACAAIDSHIQATQRILLAA